MASVNNMKALRAWGASTGSSPRRMFFCLDRDYIVKQKSALIVQLTAQLPREVD